MSALRLFVTGALASVALVTASAPLAAAAGSKLSVRLDPPRLLVGDSVTATISLPLSEVPPGANLLFPDWSEGWGKAEVIQASPVTTEGDGPNRSVVQRLTLTAFEPGRLTLPPKELRLGDSQVLRTPADLALEVRSVLAADDQELKPAPPAPPRALPVPRTAWLALGVGLALAVVAGLLAWRRKLADDPLAAPQLASLAELERALALLAESPPADAFRGLSTALRRYLGRSFGFHALESTTTEIHRRLAERGMERDLVLRGVQTLRLSDQVKFARRPASQEERNQSLHQTRELASTLEAALHPAPAKADAGRPSNPEVAA